MNRAILAFGLWALVLSVDAAESPTEAEAARAFAQAREASVLVAYDSDHGTYVSRPETEHVFRTDAELFQHLASAKLDRRFIVIVLDKFTLWSGDSAKPWLDATHKHLKDAGYERIVIQWGQTFGRRILRE